MITTDAKKLTAPLLEELSNFGKETAELFHPQSKEPATKADLYELSEKTYGLVGKVLEVLNKLA